eukprot:CAMPEP_0204632216 /NCGR_PEP_ID=MMETSP0717-20131115/24489_1 /ASSEMBLY_ACC=CAM_ASM_000666 /TAXON_ID=230516 /ORGANISM="Chaetoceros curvisetus" /LENGTH=126 /DNA_ID=CAMNT_0051650007 /DNA_START=82 /DNA_END=462 /DNA_ORIENTATION=+
MIPSIIAMGLYFLCDGEYRTINTHCEAKKAQANENESGSGSDSSKVLDDEEEEETCPFCQYFLASPCREEFKPWHNCIKNSEQAIDCMEPFHPLKDCMEKHGMIMGQEDDDGEEGDENDIHDNNSE